MMKERDEPMSETPVLEAKNLYHVYTSNEEDKEEKETESFEGFSDMFG